MTFTQTFETFFWNDTKEQPTLLKLKQNILNVKQAGIPTYEIYQGHKY